MPAQRSGSAIPPDQRSAFPGIAGVPGWGAVFIAVTASLLGLAIEAGAGHKELGSVFAGFFAVGCVAAALAVRQSGLFTAVVQPPLLLFVAVPLAYYLFHSGSFHGLKDALITCGYPLIERFPLMLFTSATTLLVGLVRWYIAMSAPATAALADGVAADPARPRGRSAKPERRPAKARHTDRANRSRRTPAPERGPRPTPARTRSARPRPEDEAPARSRREAPRRAPRDLDGPPLDAPRRRPRPAYDADPRRIPPPPRRDGGQRPPGPRPPGPRPPGQQSGGRHEAWEEPWEEPRYPRDGRRQPRPTPQSPYPPPYPPLQPPRRRAMDADVDPRNGRSTHHPVSRVRYRSDTD